MRFFWLLLVALGLGTKRHWHILFAIVLGVVCGLWFNGEAFQPLINVFNGVAQFFIRLITMIVLPLVVSSLVVGVASLGDHRQLGRLTGKVLALFLGVMVIASVVGAGLATYFQPGKHLATIIQQEQHTGGLAFKALEHTLTKVNHPPDLWELFFNMIPNNPIAALAGGELVPVIFFTLIFGFAMAYVGDAGKPLLTLFESLFTTTMKITDWVMVLSVPGIFSLTYITVASAGLEPFRQLAPYIMVLMLGLLTLLLVVFPIMLRILARVDFVHVYRAISEAMMVAFGTASSSATLPITIACCERRVGISSRIASFVMPTGVTINKSATTMFEVIAVLVLLQAYNVPMSPMLLGLVVLFSIIASIGTAGVPSGGLITISIVLNSVGVSSQDMMGGIALLWSVDRVLDMCRTVVNVVGTCSVATIVASQEMELNRDVLTNKDVWTDVLS
jgi:proton glutamate symport protein